MLINVHHAIHIWVELSYKCSKIINTYTDCCIIAFKFVLLCGSVLCSPFSEDAKI